MLRSGSKRTVAEFLPTTARLQGVWSVEHPGACREHPEQDGRLLGGETRLNDQSAELNLSAGVRLSLPGGHRSPMHVGPDKQRTAVEPDESGSFFEPCNS